VRYVDILEAAPDALRAHYRSVRELAYNNGRMAQHCRPNGRTMRRLASQMGFLMRQIDMCETAARRRGLSLIYRIHRETTDGGYLVDHIMIGLYSEENSARRLAGTVDNVDGSGDAAVRMGRVFHDMVSAGISTFYDYPGYPWGSSHMGIRWRTMESLQDLEAELGAIADGARVARLLSVNDSGPLVTGARKSAQGY